MPSNNAEAKKQPVSWRQFIEGFCKAETKELYNGSKKHIPNASFADSPPVYAFLVGLSMEYIIPIKPGTQPNLRFIKVFYECLTETLREAFLEEKAAFNKEESEGDSDAYWLLRMLVLAIEKEEGEAVSKLLLLTELVLNIENENLLELLGKKISGGERQGETLLYWLMRGLVMAALKQNVMAVKRISDHIGKLLKDLPADQRFDLLRQKKEGGETPCYWLMAALYNAALKQNVMAVKTISDHIGKLLKDLNPDQRVELLGLKEESGEAACYCLIAALYIAVDKLDVETINKLSNQIDKLFEGLSPDQRFKLLGQKEEAGLTPCYWLMAALDNAADKLDVETINILSDQIDKLFEGLSPEQRFKLLWQKEESGEAACYCLIAALYIAVDKLDVETINKLSNQIDKLFEGLSSEQRFKLLGQKEESGVTPCSYLMAALYNAALKQNVKAVKTISDRIGKLLKDLPADQCVELLEQTTKNGETPFYWSMSALINATSKKESALLNDLWHVVESVFEKLSGEKLIQFLSIKNSDGKMFCELLMERVSSSQSTSPSLSSAESLAVKLIARVGKISHQHAGLKAILVKYRDNLKAEIKDYIRLHSSRADIESIIHPDTLMGQLIDAKNNPVLDGLFGRKDTQLRNDINLILNERAKKTGDGKSNVNVQGEVRKDTKIPGGEDKKSSLGVIDDNVEVKDLKVEKPIQLMPLEDLLREIENMPIGECDGEVVFKGAHEDEQCLLKEINKVIALASSPAIHANDIPYLKQKKKVLEAACSVIKCVSDEASMNAFVRAIEENPGYAHSFRHGEVSKTLMIVKELIRLYPWIDLKLKERRKQLEQAISKKQIGLFHENLPDMSEEGRAKALKAVELQTVPAHCLPVDGVVVKEEQEQRKKLSALGSS